jgi:tetratricopeptide (TPR) repeat protein
VTVAHEILKLEARFGAGRQDEIALGRLLQKARRSLPAAQGATDGQEARKRLAAIQEFLKQEGFRYHSTSFLYEALRTSNSDCDTSTLIYCAIGEVMGYPLGAVALPRHAFVRWSLPHGSVINWETTETNRNASFSDGSYYDWLLKGMTGEGCNLRTLTRQQLPAIHHYMAGLAFASMRRYDEALEEHDMALKIEPGWYISRLEKSSVHLLRESYAGGAVEALKAMEYLPADELGQLSAAAIALAVIAKQDAAVDRSQLGRVVRGFMRPDSDSAGYVVLTALDSFLDDRGSSAMADLHGACAKWPTNFVPFLCRAALKGRGGDAVGARKDSEEAVRLMRAGGVTRNVRALQSPARREERQP